MSNARALVERFLTAFYAGAPDARHLLADDLVFTGPMSQVTGADTYLKAAAHVAPGVTGLEIHTIIAEGSNVAVFYDLLLDHRVGRLPVAEWYQVDGGQIVAIRMILDTAPFVRGAAAERRATAIDPVCGMVVEIQTAAATVEYGGTTYVFCNPGCAAAFREAPEHFVTAS